MDGSNIITRWVVLLLAEVLNLGATVAEKILFGQPRWVAYLRLLEANMRAPAQAPDSGPQESAKDESGDISADTTRQVLESYAILSRVLKDIEARGLALDDALVERMKDGWSPKSIVGYLMTCDTQIKKEIAEALKAAAEKIAAPPAPAVSHDRAGHEPRGDMVS